MIFYLENDNNEEINFNGETLTFTLQMIKIWTTKWLLINLKSKKCVIYLGVRDLTIFVLIWLKLKMKVNIVFSMKVKPHILNAFLKMNLFNKINDVSN